MSYEDTEHSKLKSNSWGRGPEMSSLTWSTDSKAARKLEHSEQGE